MNLMVETFSDVRPSDVFDEREADEYAQTGLAALARVVAQRQRAPALGKCLTRSELAVWRWRYPTRYEQGRDRDSGEIYNFTDKQTVRPWETLLWPVPQEVRQLILEKQDAFDRLEIWTPELRRAVVPNLSPILVGVRADDRFLLARWAEALEPFEEIRARMLCRRGQWAMTVRRLYTEPDFRGARVGMPLFFGGLALFAAAAAAFHPSVVAASILLGLAGWSLAWGMHHLWMRFPRSIDRACKYAGWVQPAQK